MMANYCESALIEICRSFLKYLQDLKQNGRISEAEYEVHSRMKLMFIKEVENLRMKK
ncbi:MAG: hypothetical protein PHG58_07235 [Clostridia bacterium]|nr:hypothetical protein [Clostridia bacterium]